MTKKKKSKAHPPRSAAEEAGIKVEFLPNVLEEDFYHHQDKTQLVGAIDQGTSSTRFLLFTAKGRIAASAQMEHEQIYPQTGWHEHDPVVLWQNTAACMAAVANRVRDKVELNRDTVAAIGLTNQRETVLAWNRETGQPYHNAIVWDDTRTAAAARALQDDPTRGPPLTATTGLPISSYFAGTKVRWLLDHVEALRNDVRDQPEQVCFGTVDSWLLFQLTGQVPKSPTTGRKLKGAAGAVNTGGIFETDVTNASRWLFMDLQTCQWDPDCVAAVLGPDHFLPTRSCLPAIRPSSHVFGHVPDGCGLAAAWTGVPLASVLGDQQAALFGQAASRAGQAKNTYGTGLFLMMNTGPTIVRSRHGLLTTVAYQLGSNDGQPGPVQYALEGSVSHSGSTIQWLRDQLQILKDASESEPLARSVASSEGLYMVPAFAGLFAPHWRSDARGCLVGIQMSHTKAHVCRAALEAAAYQTLELFDAIGQDVQEQEQGILGTTQSSSSSSSAALTSLKVDGGGTHNKLLLQFQADILGVPVVKPVVMETTGMGAAFAAGLAVGVWRDLAEIESLWAVAETYTPKMGAAERARKLRGWNKAVSRSLGWVGGEEDGEDDDAAAAPDLWKPLPAAAPRAARPVVEQEDETVEQPRSFEPVEEEKKSPDVVFESRPEEAVAVKEKDTPPVPPQQANRAAADTSRAVIAPSDVPQKASDDDNSLTGDSYSAKTLGLTAAAALAVGILLGSARSKR